MMYRPFLLLALLAPTALWAQAAPASAKAPVGHGLSSPAALQAAPINTIPAGGIPASVTSSSVTPISATPSTLAAGTQAAGTPAAGTPVPGNLAVPPSLAVPVVASQPAAAPAVSSSSPSTLSARLAAQTKAAQALTGADDSAVPTDLDATAVRQAAHLKTQIDLEKLRTALQSEQQGRVLAQRKFVDDMSGKDTTASATGKAASPAQAAAAVPVHPRPYAASIYTFGEHTYAQVVIDGATLLAVPGRTLPNGAKVVAINDSGVVLSQNGHRSVIPVQGSSMLPYAGGQP